MARVTVHKNPRPQTAAGAAAHPTDATAAAEEMVITDDKGRKLTLRDLDLLEEQDLLAAMPAEHCANGMVLGRAMMAAQVAAIDGAPVLLPTNDLTYRAMLQRVGKAGVAAVMAHTMQPGADNTVEKAKNS